MGYDGGEKLPRFDNFREEVGSSNGKLRSPAGGKTAIGHFDSILLSIYRIFYAWVKGVRTASGSSRTP